MTEQLSANEENRAAWDANAEVWDAKMADQGNDFVNLLQWPVIQPLLNIQPGQKILDIACGNGLFSRRLAALGADVVAIDFSAELIERAKARKSDRITYQVMDVTDETALLTSVSILSNPRCAIWRFLTLRTSNQFIVRYPTFSNQAEDSFSA